MNRNVEQWRISKAAAVSDLGIVASQHHLASRAGAAVLDKGGDAIDAAVACAFALNAVEPWMCGLGGSGYMVIWHAATAQAYFVDFQGVLAQATDCADYPLDPDVPDSLMGFPGVAGNRNVAGYGSITVPGAVAGLSSAVERFGELGLDTVLEPAITLARRGLPVGWFATLNIALEMGDLMKDPTAADIFLPGGAPARPEQFLPIAKMAETLETLAAEGPDVFYRGCLAEAMAGDLQEGGSKITAEDFAAYDAEWRDPLSSEHRGATLYMAGETSGGLRLNETLAYVAKHLDTTRPFGAHTYSVYAKGLNKAFLNHKARVGQIQRAGCTSHMSACDAEGNMVALTYTLLNRFGAKVVLPSTGMTMNNAVSYFDPRPGFPTSMEGGKRINSSNMCPTVAVRDGRARFAVGASGANHIVPCTTQIAGWLLDYGMSLEDVFNLPRIDASGIDRIRVDPAMGEAALTALAGEFELEIAQRLVFPKLYSCPSGVMHDPESGLNYGISDPSNPSAGAAAAAPLVLDDDESAGTVSVRA